MNILFKVLYEALWCVVPMYVIFMPIFYLLKGLTLRDSAYRCIPFVIGALIVRGHLYFRARIKRDSHQ